MNENQQDNRSNENPQKTDDQATPNNETRPPEIPDTVYVSWTAKEFIEHKKSIGWFLLLGLGLILISVAIYFIVHSIFAVAMIVLIGLAFAIVAGRPPKELNYELNNVGLLVGKRSNSYNEFKSFSIIDEKDLGSIVFNPLKRFVFPTIIYYDLTNEEKIVNVLIEHLPIEEPDNDPIGQLMRRIRF